MLMIDFVFILVLYLHTLYFVFGVVLAVDRSIDCMHSIPMNSDIISCSDRVGKETEWIYYRNQEPGYPHLLPSCQYVVYQIFKGYLG